MQWAHKNTTVVSRSTSIVRTKKGEYLCDGNCGVAWRKAGYSFYCLEFEADVFVLLNVKAQNEYKNQNKG